MSKIRVWRFFLAAMAVALLSAGLTVAQRPSADATLTGTVTSHDGKPMEGVAVSARASGDTFTTTVYTNERGDFSFLALSASRYKLWAQAVGFEMPQAEISISGGGKNQQMFEMKALDDFTKQLNGDEIIAGLPEETMTDRREKKIFLNACTSCHPANFALQNRFDEKGWRAILSFMRKTDMFAVIADPDRAAPVIKAYEEEIVNYLTRVRGPASDPTNFKLVPRPSGEAAKVVVTEYDLSPGNQPAYYLEHNGTFWLEGTPSAHEAYAAHDLAVDPQGQVWFQDQVNPERTIGSLDPRTGKVSSYKLSGKDGTSVGTHGVGVDADGNVWFTNSEEGTLSMFDPKTKQFKRYPRPASMSPVRRTIVDIDSKGNIWTITNEGALRLNPKTGEYAEFKSATPGGSTYGIAIDAKDNAWWAQMGADQMSIADPSTGKVSGLKFKPFDDIELTDYDRKMVASVEPTATSGFFFQKGPRRLGADRKGDTVWVADFYGDLLARININTKEVKEYPLPNPYTRPYAVVVDKNQKVWVSLMNTDRVAKFDPVTEKFTEYLLPTRGTEARFIAVDNNTDPPSVWIPYFRTNKIARLQFPKDSGGTTKAAAK